MKVKAESLPKSLQKYADKISGIEDYRKSGEGYWVHLVEGWKYDETHSIHEDNVTECAKCMKWIERCTDPACCKPAE